MSDRPIQTCADILAECASMPELVPLLNSLTGYHLRPQSALDRADARAFAAFVATRVWEPLVAALARAEAAEDHW
jgi:hypothetical protein